MLMVKYKCSKYIYFVMIFVGLYFKSMSYVELDYEVRESKVSRIIKLLLKDIEIDVKGLVYVLIIFDGI